MVEVLWALLPMLQLSGLCNRMVHHTQHEQQTQCGHANMTRKKKSLCHSTLQQESLYPEAAEGTKAIAGGDHLLMATPWDNLSLSY